MKLSISLIFLEYIQILHGQRGIEGEVIQRGLEAGLKYEYFLCVS